MIAKKLSIAFYWHMHQPAYKIDNNMPYLMPWARLHAVKDYYDMVAILENFKSIKLNFNLVPLLLDSLIDYAENNVDDVHSKLSQKEISDMSVPEKEFVLNNFFDANYQCMIYPHEAYRQLYTKRHSMQSLNVDDFTDQEISDIMAWFNLSWIDSVNIKRYPEIQSLIDKQTGYTTDDRIKIINLHRQIIKDIIPTYKKYLDEGRIEITTSPYYHPILPVLVDIKNVAKAEDLPENFKATSDAKTQIKMALDRIEELFGKRPKGLWPSEHALSSKTLEFLKTCGIEWTISDEGILSNSINFEFIRDFKGNMEDPYHLLKTYKEKDVKIIFRDASIPNLISFDYPNHTCEIAANDLYDKIKVIQNKILTSPDDNHLLTIALDGENCWENYPQDGSTFLNMLYSMIENDETLETVLISDYLEKDNSTKELTKLHAGSWINRDFKLWIDEPVKNLAWTYLKQVHDDLDEFKKQNPNHPQLANAKTELMIAEGSDWFWWYGEPNNSGKDHIFDYLFREHLKRTYKLLGLNVPSYLEKPLANAMALPSKYPKGSMTPNLSGKVEFDDEWLNAGCIKIPDGPVLQDNKIFEKICFGYSNTDLYLRIYKNNFLKETKHIHQLYIYFRNSETNQTLSPIRLINKTENVFPIAKEYFHTEIQLTVINQKLHPVYFSKAIPNGLWALKNSKTLQIACEDTIDICIPFDSLKINPGEFVEFCFIDATLSLKNSFIPQDSLITIQRPEIL